MKIIITSIAFTFSHCICSGAGAVALHGFGDLGGGSWHSAVVDVNADGTICVGQSSGQNGLEAAKWSMIQGIVGLGDIPGGTFSSLAAAVSSDGAIIVGSGRSANGNEAFRWTAVGGAQGLGAIPGAVFNSGARDVSADGAVIVGSSWTSAGPQPVRWINDNGIEQLPLPAGAVTGVAEGISGDGSVVIGNCGSRAVRWVNGAVDVLDSQGEGVSTFAYETNFDGSVIVGKFNSSAGLAAFVWTELAGFLFLGDIPDRPGYPARLESEARGVSANGQIVVGVADRDGSQCAFVWTQAIGMWAIDSLLTQYLGFDLNGWELRGASSISADGDTIVGWGVNPSGMFEAWILYLPQTTACAGDVNRDGNANVLDFNILASNFGLSVPAGFGGDFDGDGLVTATDFNILAADFGCTTP